MSQENVEIVRKPLRAHERSLDTSFSGDGKQTTDFGGSDFATGVAAQGDGKIVVVGEGIGTDGTEDFALARYLGG